MIHQMILPPTAIKDPGIGRRPHHKEGHHHHHSHPHPRGGAKEETRQHGTREIKVVRRVLDANDIMADQNRARFSEKKVFALNMMSSPGSGKTTTLIRTLKGLMPAIRCAVIVGDICSTYDADQLSVTGAPVVQINTDEFGGDCHLAAHVVAKALADIDLDDVDLLVVENVGNLVCPAEFDMGEDRRVVVLSVAEGEEIEAYVVSQGPDGLILSQRLAKGIRSKEFVRDAYHSRIHRTCQLLPN